MLSSPFDAFVRVLLSPACAACDTLLEHPLRSPVCASCWRAIHTIRAPWCTHCGDMLPGWRDVQVLCARCRRAPRQFALARSAGVYDGALREIIHAFKYGGRRVLARPLGAMMKACGEEVLAGADAVIPIPLHPLRALRRGFNQADDLAQQIGLPVWRPLRRARHGPPQAGLPAARRHANVRGAFALRPSFRAALWRRRLAGRTVVLVDDVMTTGATLDACGAVLLSAGVRNVRALTVARAVAARPVRPPRPPRPSTARHR